MKKLEVLELLKKNSISSTNLKTFINKNKKLNLNYNLAFRWLENNELKEHLKNKNKFEKIRLKKEADKFKMSIKEYTTLYYKAIEILNDFHTGHSMGCYKNVNLNGVLFCSNHELEEYSNSCKYKEVYGTVNINITKKELRKIENIEGVWTVKGKNHKCKILVSEGEKQHFIIYFENCFLFANTHGNTLQEAKEDFRKKIIQAKKGKLKNSKFVGVEHIRKTGACMAGIKAFAAKYKLNLDFGYNVGFLKSLDNNNTFLNRL